MFTIKIYGIKPVVCVVQLKIKINRTTTCAVLLIHSITSCTTLQYPISEEVFVHSKFYIVCFFYYPKHCTLCIVSWQIQGFCVIKLLCMGR